MVSKTIAVISVALRKSLFDKKLKMIELNVMNETFEDVDNNNNTADDPDISMENLYPALIQCFAIITLG